MKNTLIKALRHAGKIQMSHYGGSVPSIQKESISSIVTEVDMAAEKAIMETIREVYAVHNFLGEESGFTNNGSEWTWIVDPLDGTSNYAASLPWFGVLIAVLKRKTPVMAGAYLPVEDKLFFAEAGMGTHMNGQRLHILPSKLSDVLFAFSTNYTDDPVMADRGMAGYRFIMSHTRNVRSTNSLVDMLYILEGKFGGCINLFTKIWDIAAPWLLIREAGGLLTGIDGKPIEFEVSGNASSVNYPIIAGHGKLVQAILELLPR